ncbi:helix-turn-helix domain-containing protein [Sphingobacterium wenxiniae]|nr:helix-turn-helix domain-containing protein [Sphingobacterium wenxiniae]
MMKRKINQLIETVATMKDLLEQISAVLVPTDTPVQQHALMTAKEVQHLFGIVHSTYYRWIERGYLKPIILGGKHYYQAKDIYLLLEKRKYRERGGMEQAP